MSSVSKMRVAFGGMTPPAPRSPYPSSGGMVSLRFSPTHMPSTPWSHPLMTCPEPSLKGSGVPRSYLHPFHAHTMRKERMLPPWHRWRMVTIPHATVHGREQRCVQHTGTMGRSSVRAVKLLAVVQGAVVVHLDLHTMYAPQGPSRIQCCDWPCRARLQAVLGKLANFPWEH